MLFWGLRPLSPIQDKLRSTQGAKHPKFDSRDILVDKLGNLLEPRLSSRMGRHTACGGPQPSCAELGGRDWAVSIAKGRKGVAKGGGGVGGGWCEATGGETPPIAGISES